MGVKSYLTGGVGQIVSVEIYFVFKKGSQLLNLGISKKISRFTFQSEQFVALKGC